MIGFLAFGVRRVVSVRGLIGIRTLSAPQILSSDFFKVAPRNEATDRAEAFDFVPICVVLFGVDVEEVAGAKFEEIRAAGRRLE